MFLMDMLMALFVQLSSVVGPTLGPIFGLAILVGVIILVWILLRWFTDKFMNF